MYATTKLVRIITISLQGKLLN